MTKNFLSRSLLSLATSGLLLGAGSMSADEQYFGYVRGAETLPQGHFDLYEVVTLREGKPAGNYHAWDFNTEVEYGFTDKFQMSAALLQHYFAFQGVDGLGDGSTYRIGGGEISGKYRFTSVFMDGYGLALRGEAGFLRYDDVGGIEQKEYFFAPELIFQKNFIDDTLIFDANAGVELAWGKQPAEEYDHEIALEGALGLAYRFAPNWFIGGETHIRSEYPILSSASTSTPPSLLGRLCTMGPSAGGPPFPGLIKPGAKAWANRTTGRLSPRKHGAKTASNWVSISNPAVVFEHRVARPALRLISPTSA